MRRLNKIFKYGVVVVLAVLISFFTVKTDVFLTPANLINVFRQVSIVGICAVGMTFVILTGGIDLSIGSIIAVSSVFAASLMKSGHGEVTSTIIALGAGVLIGLINGAMINELKISPLISTLGSMTVLRGIAYIITDGLPVHGFSKSYRFLGQGHISGVPVPVIIMAIVFVIGYIILNKTPFGRYVYGVGGNEEATMMSGVSVKKVKYMTYALSGLMAALAGVVLLSRINSGQPNAGIGYELDVVTAVVLGGISVNGGEGKLTGVLAGIFIMGILTNGMILMNINEYYQSVAKGLVLITAVGVDGFTKRNNK